jgi:hypothetical protein
MGGYGSMNIVMKNNRNLLRKRRGIKEIYGGSSSSEQPEFNLPQATPRQLNNIKLRIQSERRERYIIIILVFGLVFSSVIVLLQAIL